MSQSAPASPSLGLGSAQFGSSYGLTSTGQAVTPGEVAQILAVAEAASLSMLDTAPAYGDSESVLGGTLAACHNAGRNFRIVTKLPSLRAGRSREDKKALAKQSFEHSLARLRRRRIHGLILHDAADLAGADGVAIVDLLDEWRARGLVQRIGVSVYDMHQIDQAMEMQAIDLLQMPVNVFDQRLLDGARLADLQKRGVELHARSAFLQGLLLMGEADIPAHLAHARSHVARYRKALAAAGVSPLVAALAFVKSIAALDHVIIGVHSARHLGECLTAYQQTCAFDFAPHRCADLSLIDPRRWGRPQ